MNKGRKRIFILLGMASLLLYGAVFGAIWYLMTGASPLVRHLLLTAVAAVLVLCLLAMAAGLGCLVLGLLFGAAPPFVQRLGRGVVELFYPMVLHLGQLWGISREAIEDSYIKINNQMTEASAEKLRPDEVLVLAPHCLQNASCPHKITLDVHNCHRCGRCSVDGLLTISEETGVHFVVASGGTFARKFVEQYRPKAVVAIACGRDLVSGIKDMSVQHIPVVGVLNERPNGPCYNTTVHLCQVRQAIGSLIEP